MIGSQLRAAARNTFKRMGSSATGLALSLSLSAALAAGSALGLTAAAQAAPPNAHDLPSPGETVAVTASVVAEDLGRPWGLSWLPGGEMLVADLEGKLWRVDGDTKIEITGVPEVYFASQGGFFEAVPHPDFAQNNWLYLIYAHGDRSENATRVARAKLDGTTLSDLEVLFTAQFLKDTPVHYGGRIEWLPDGTFVLTLGDGFNYREEAQNNANHIGTMVRLNADGSVPEDNPFTDQEGALPEIYSYGHRNAQGIAYDAEADVLYTNEHGPQGGDEINIAKPGANYGWPVITYGRDYSGALISPYTEKEGMEQPLVYWTPSEAPSGMAIYRGDVYPAWDGDLFVSMLAGRHLERIDLEDGKPVAREILLGDLGIRVRDVQVGPDGKIYILSDGKGDNGRVYRLDPS